MAKRTIAERSFQTSVLAQFLSEPRETASYTELSRVAGVDVQAEGRGALTSARRIVRNECGLHYEIEHGVGLSLVQGGGFVGVGRASISKMHREANRGLQKLSCAKPDEMTNDEKVAFNAAAAGLGVMSTFTQIRTVKRLEAAQKTATARLSFEDTLNAFRGNGINPT